MSKESTHVKNERTYGSDRDFGRLAERFVQTAHDNGSEVLLNRAELIVIILRALRRSSFRGISDPIAEGNWQHLVDASDQQFPARLNRLQIEDLVQLSDAALTDRVEWLIKRYVSIDSTRPVSAAGLVAGLAWARPMQFLDGAGGAMSHVSSSAPLDGLLEDVGVHLMDLVRDSRAPGSGHRPVVISGHSHDRDVDGVAPALPDFPAFGDSDGNAGSMDESVAAPGDAETETDAVEAPPEEPEPDLAQAEPPADDGAPPPPVRTVYSSISVEGHGGSPSVVVAGEEFGVRVGISSRRLPRVSGTGALQLDASTTSLDLVLVFDPASFELVGPRQLTLPITGPADYPTLPVKMTATHNDLLVSERRIGVQYFHTGRLIGIAFATVAVADDQDAAKTATVSAAPPPGLLDISVLLQPAAPDLVLTLIQSDDAAIDRFVWSAYSARTDFTIPDLSYRDTALSDADVQNFTANLRSAVATTGQEDHLFADLVGKGQLIAQRIPPEIVATIADLLQHSPTRAPSVLLLSEELAIPWELARVSLTSPTGGTSPFLGAHLALGRWPLTRAEPRPRLISSISVTQSATVSDGYVNVKSVGLGPGIKALPSAPKEALAYQDAYPPSQPIAATWTTVQQLLAGDPQAEVIHVALHGNFDPTGNASGLVLIRTDAGQQSADIITPTQLAIGHLANSPFVFLNACQVASEAPVLGDYSGMAGALLNIGAAAVVASIWNVNDDIASDTALTFYRQVFVDKVPAGEALRSLRAKYTQAAAGADPKITSTLIGYQLFGHPNLMLSR